MRALQSRKNKTRRQFMRRARTSSFVICGFFARASRISGSAMCAPNPVAILASRNGLPISSTQPRYGSPSSNPATTNVFRKGSKLLRLSYMIRVNQVWRALGLRPNPLSSHSSLILLNKKMKVLVAWQVHILMKWLKQLTLSAQWELSGVENQQYLLMLPR